MKPGGERPSPYRPPGPGSAGFSGMAPTFDGTHLVLDDQAIPLTTSVLEGLSHLRDMARIPASRRDCVEQACNWIDELEGVYLDAVPVDTPGGSR